jgi:hypothetical protein
LKRTAIVDDLSSNRAEDKTEKSALFECKLAAVLPLRREKEKSKARTIHRLNRAAKKLGTAARVERTNGNVAGSGWFNHIVDRWLIAASQEALCNGHRTVLALLPILEGLKKSASF